MKELVERAARARPSDSRVRAFFARVALLLSACAVASGAHAQESVCAEVKIEIKQTVTLERQAFDAKLKIRNGLGLPVEAIDVSLRFADADGVAVPATTNPDDNGGAKFFFRTDGTTDITGELTGTGAVAPQKTGEAHWLIVPTASAGGQTPDGIAYRVGATITYRIGNETKTVEVTPDAITVKPQPKLRLDYFLTREVYGDDPMTPAIEPLVPFTLGVRVWNYGYGRANAVAIESGQPQIRRGGNEQGLLIDFRILDSYADDAPAQPTLALGFGDIVPGKAKIGRWNMTASLSGYFYKFEATLHHADEFGGALTALIDEANTVAHDLVHDVLADAPGRDGVRDFLAYDGDVPRLYESDGGLVPGGTGALDVTAVAGTLTGSGNSRQLAFAAVPGGFVYAKIADPFNGQLDAIEARRGDGKTIPAANVWFSKERDASAERWLYFINVFDFHDASLAGQVTYRLDTSTAPTQPASLRGAVYEDVDGDGVHGANEPAMFDVEVALDGTADDGQAVARTARTDALGGFAFTQVPSGSYRLGVGDVAGYRNGLHAAGTAGGTVTAAEILSIPLAAGANTGGYTFAKMQQGVVTQQADLAVVAVDVVDTTRIVYTRPFTVRVQVRNDGPDSVPAAVRIVASAGLILADGAPTAGRFDLATGLWQVGPMQAGVVQTLDLYINATMPGNATLQAIAVIDDPQATDPQPSNNYRSREIVLNKPGNFRIDAAVDDAPRVLVLSTCVTNGGGPVELRATPSAADGDTCLFGRAVALDALFTSLGVPHLVVHGELAFYQQLRSGSWNTYWIDAGTATLLSDATNRELAQALLRGEWTIVDRPRLGAPPPNAGADKLEAYVPATLDTEGPVGQTVERVEVFDSPFLPAGFLSVGAEEGGVGSAYNLYRSLGSDAQDLAAFEIGQPPRPVALHRINRTLLFGFDFFSALTQATPEYRTQAMTRLLGATRPSRETVFEAGSDIVFKGGITALDPIDATVGFRTPANAVLGAVEPAADNASPTYLSWRRELAAQQSIAVSLGLRLPPTDVEQLPLGFAVSTTDLGSDAVSLGGIAVEVRTSDTQATGLRTALGTLGAADAAAMRALLDQAMLQHTNGQFDNAIRKLLDISDAVDNDWRTNGSYAAPLARELGRLILWWQREAFSSPVECAPGSSQQRAANATGKKGGAKPASSACPNPES